MGIINYSLKTILARLFLTLLAVIKNKICDDVLEDYVNPNEHL